MKITPREIDGFLKRRPAVAVVLLYGPDHGLIRERGDIIGKTITPDLNDPFNTATLTGDQAIADPARFIDETKSLSLMGGDRLVRMTSAGDGFAPILKDYLKAPSPGCLVLIESGDLPPKSPLRQACEKAEAATALPCYVAEGADLIRLIEGEIRAANLKIDRDAAQFLAQAIGGDQQQVRGEIEKLLTYMGVDAAGKGQGETVTLNDALACSGAMGAAALDAFIDAWLLDDTAKAFQMLDRLHAEDTADVLILRAFMAHVRRLQQAQERASGGVDPESAMKALEPKIFWKREAVFLKQLAKWPLHHLDALMHRLLMAERTSKSGRTPDVLMAQDFLSTAV